MSVALITGSSGLVGSEAVSFFLSKGFDVVGIDNDMRSYFFGNEASTLWKSEELKKNHGFTHFEIDIRDFCKLSEIFSKYNSDISLILHTAAQPSHDWAAKEPFTDFSVNAVGTLNLLEACRKFCKDAIFIFTSTNKVYGDTPNYLPLMELDFRYEIQKDHPYYGKGINEEMSVDRSTHSLFGVSKLSADLLVQEYGRYFGLNTVCFRGGCLTGPAHSGAELHGFLSYLIKCFVLEKKYTVFGYKGKQVRDNIHSSDLIDAFWQFYGNPKKGEVYNIGGGIFSNISILEVILYLENKYEKKMNYTIDPTNRVGDHIWYVSDLSKFITDYPDWKIRRDMHHIIDEIYTETVKRFK